MPGRVAARLDEEHGHVLPFRLPELHLDQTFDRVGEDEADPIKVLLADDHTMFRQGIASVLADYGGMQIVGQTDNDEGAVELARLTHLLEEREETVALGRKMGILDIPEEASGERGTTTYDGESGVPVGGPAQPVEKPGEVNVVLL